MEPKVSPFDRYLNYNVCMCFSQLLLLHNNFHKYTFVRLDRVKTKITKWLN